MRRSYPVLVASIMVGIIVISILGMYAYIRLHESTIQTKSRASTSYTLQSIDVADTSQFRESKGALIYDLVPAQANTALFELPHVSREAVTQFLTSQPAYSLYNTGTEPQVLIPDAKETIRLKGEYSDATITEGVGGEAFGLQNADAGKMHYYYEQTRCGGVPVFASYINIHVNQSADVYAMSGSLAQGDTKCASNKSKDEAQAIAQAQFEKDFTQNATVQRSVEYVYNPELIYETGSTSYLTHFVTVCDERYCHGYFVDQGDGTIRKDIAMSADALNRTVKAGSTRRAEGAPASTNQLVNVTYDALGTTWEYFNAKFGRDSFDGRGAILDATIDSTRNCGWTISNTIVCGQTYVALDVLAHEFTHGVTQFTAGLIYQNESGALNEGLSDTFAAAIDSEDWLLGEESGAGAIRSLQSPTQFGHPDSQVSSRYYCGGQQNTLVHTNSGVLNKAYYLMSDGGSFNGCQMQGIGRDAAIAIIYKTITTYMKGKVNGQYLDMFNSINSACGDIYGATSATCANIKVAMQATYMDKPSKCKGGSSTTQASCVGVQPGTPEPTGSQQPTPTPQTTGIPTATPTGTQPQGSPTPTITSAPTPTPTAPPIVKAQGTLLSIYSTPQLWQGNVQIVQEGTKSVLRSELYFQALQGVQLGSYLTPGSTSQLGIVGSETDLRGRLLGKNGDLEIGGFVVTDAGKILAEFSSNTDLTAYDTFEVYYKGDKANLNDLPALIAALNPPESAPEQQTKVILDLKLRFQGIERKPSSTQAQLVRIGIGGGDMNAIEYKKIVFTAVEGGIWTGRVYLDIPAGEAYKVLVKGPKHIQKKYCDNAPRETDPGNYICEAEAIALTKGVNTIDLTSVMQLVGDTNQDGRVNARDISNVRSKLGSSRAEDLLMGDLNNDGIVNAVDDSLIIYTLANRPQQS